MESKAAFETWDDKSVEPMIEKFEGIPGEVWVKARVAPVSEGRGRKGQMAHAWVMATPFDSSTRGEKHLAANTKIPLGNLFQVVESPEKNIMLQRNFL
jgi:hypothetical protein